MYTKTLRLFYHERQKRLKYKKEKEKEEKKRSMKLGENDHSLHACF